MSSLAALPSSRSTLPASYHSSSRDDSAAVPVWKRKNNWILLLSLLYFAGATFSSSQELSAGGMVTESSSGHLAGKIVPVVAYAIFLFLGRQFFLKAMVPVSSAIPFLGLCAFTFISSIWSQSPSQTLKMAVCLTLSTLFAIWFFERYSGLQQMQMLMLTGFVAAIISIFLALLVPSIGISEDKGGAWQGLFYSKNHCGRMLLFLLIAAFHYPWKRHSSKWMYVSTLAAMVIMSRSRTAMVLFAIYLVFAFVIGSIAKLNASSRRLIVFLGLPLFLLGVTLVAINLTDIIVAFGGDPTLNNRDVIWRFLLESGMKRPVFGYGYCGFWSGTTSEAINVIMATVSYMHFYGAYSHSGYIDVFLQLGITGLALLGYFLVKGLKDGLLCFLNERRTHYTDWCLGVIVLSILCNIDEVTFIAPNYLAWMMFVTASIGLAEHLRISRRSRDAYRASPDGLAGTLAYRYI